LLLKIGRRAPLSLQTNTTAGCVQKDIMNRSTILQRLVLLTAIPLVALLIFSAALISNSFGLYKNAG